MDTYNLKISKEKLKQLKTKVGHVVIFCDDHINDQSSNYLNWIDEQPLPDSEYENIALNKQEYWIKELKCCQRLLITDETVLEDVIKSLKISNHILDLG